MQKSNTYKKQIKVKFFKSSYTDYILIFSQNRKGIFFFVEIEKIRVQHDLGILVYYKVMHIQSISIVS